ncbi:hypothetical protein OFB51_27485, partial [Escherichia coli]|nr:hypothetical protein [Escherichia coli]
SVTMVHSSVLYHNDNRTVFLLDLPRSIEEAQLLPRELDDGALTPLKLRTLISEEAPLLPRGLDDGALTPLQLRTLIS